MYEITHFVVDAEMDEACLYMAPQQRTRPQEIEDDPPASNLRMVIAAGMILPIVSETIAAVSFRQCPNQYGRPVHISSRMTNRRATLAELWPL
jgi:hypothetical protein